MDTTSLWHGTARLPDGTPGPPGGSYDVAVVGAGLTGLTTAVMLARAGCSVVVLEARSVGAGTTGNTTAKISLLQGTRLSAIARRQSTETVAEYVRGNAAGQEWLLSFCAAQGVPVERRAAVTYAASAQDRSSVEAEQAACESVGLGVTWQDGFDVPFPTAGGISLAEQAQFHPLEALAALAREAVAAGVRVHTGTQVVDANGTDGVVRTSAGEVRAERVVLATGIPISDRGAFFARVEPQRSYAIALRAPEPVYLDMYLSSGSPSRSVRTAPLADGQALVVGGNGHLVGRVDSERECFDDLVAWSRTHVPGATLTHRWSAQDYHPVDELPFVGSLTPSGERVLVATGFSKWGMTNAVAAALVLTGRITGGEPEWADAYRSWSPHELGGAVQAVRANVAVAATLVSDRAALLTRTPGDQPAEGQGCVWRDGLDAVAVSTVDGVTRTVSATCTHLGGIVHWNDAERSWDCPLHGSRFSPSGALLEGPATADLARPE